MHKQISQSRIIDNLNRMSQPLKGKTFLGFKRVYWGNRWGFSVDGHNFCAVYSWDKQVKTPVTVDKKEETQLDGKKFFSILLQGVGDLSFVKRFESKEAADLWFYADAIINSEVDKSLLKVDNKPPVKTPVPPLTKAKVLPKIEKVVSKPLKIDTTSTSKPLSKQVKYVSEKKEKTEAKA
jgi:hypothetical protein